MNSIATDATANIKELAHARIPGYSLDQRFYTDRHIFDRDMNAIFNQQWLLVDHVSRIPDPGDYFLFEIGSESIIVIREDDETVNAFYNVCRHRGSKVCLEAQGNKRFLTCPYHAWAYNLDGSLKAARSMQEDFDPAQHGLHSAMVRVFEGLIFLNLSREAPPDFDELYGVFQPMLNFHGIGKAKIAHKGNYPTSANWKLVVENFIECYHCAPAHPEYCSVHPSDQLLAYGAGPGSGPEAAEIAYGTTLEEWGKKVEDMGHENILHTSDEDSLVFAQGSRFPINDRGALSETFDGSPASARLMGSFAAYDGGETAISFNPCNYVLAFNDFAVMFRFTPRDTIESDVELTWLVDESAEVGVDYDVERLIKVWDITIRQDKTITENNQLGVGSSRYQPGPYSEHERLVQSFTQWYLNRISDNAE